MQGEVYQGWSAMSAPEPQVLQALQGHTELSDKWPGPRAVKIYVAAVYNGKISIKPVLGTLVERDFPDIFSYC